VVEEAIADDAWLMVVVVETGMDVCVVGDGEAERGRLSDARIQ